MLGVPRGAWGRPHAPRGTPSMGPAPASASGGLRHTCCAAGRGAEVGVVPSALVLRLAERLSAASHNRTRQSQHELVPRLPFGLLVSEQGSLCTIEDLQKGGYWILILNLI